MTIQPPVTRVGAAIIMVVGLFVEGCALVLLVRGERGPGVASFAIFGLSALLLGLDSLADCA